MGNKSLDIEIGRRLRQARMAKGLTQKEMAAAIGLSHQSIQKYENGESRLSLSTLALLRHQLGIEAADLLPAIRADGTAVADPLASMAQSITGVRLANLFGRMRPDQQQSLLNVAKAIVPDAVSAT
ncbi:helix-turn-helix transcriptional regulator [Brevundimonas sp.]|uniref:helix-turn-helix domain-containing protein n=1 Tax=Brevundimonas sp. TaxID=1871086 RepID=UPI00289D5802|nr:helix-turn-helix transcriptional regulator [Brevundimonas sp.]